MRHDTRRRDVLTVDQVVGDVEEAGDEGRVAGDALRHPGVALARVGQLLAEEAALGPDRDDDGVLDHLRLDQAEHLGAEVVASVAPAQPAAGHRTEAQVHALDPRRVDEDLELRAWLGQVGDVARAQLERDVGLRPVPAVGALVEVRAQRGAHRRQVGAEDAVVVEADDLVESPQDLVRDRLLGLRAPLGVVDVQVGVEAGLEQRQQASGDVDVVEQRLLDVVLRERGAALAHVLRVGAQHRRLPPRQPDREDQGVEPVGLVLPVPHRGHGVLEQLAGVGRDRAAVAEPEVVDEGRRTQAVELVGPLVDDLDAHRGQHGQHVAQRQRRADAEHLQPRLAGTAVHRLVERQRQCLAGLVGLERLEAGQVDRAGAGRVVLLVGLGEGVGVPTGQAHAPGLAVLLAHRSGEVVGPRAGGVGQHALQLRHVDVGLHGLPARRADHEVQPSQHRLRDAGGVLRRLAAELPGQDRRDPLAHRGVVAVAGQVDQARQVAAVGVGPHEQPQPAPLAGVEHRVGDGDQVLQRGLEQLVTGVGLEHVHEGLAGVALPRDPGRLDHGVRLLAHDGDARQRLGVGGRGVEAQEPALTDDLAAGVERLHPDVVEVDRAVHGRARVGLGQHQQRLLAGLGPHQLGHPAVVGHVGVGPQDPAAGAGHGHQRAALHPVEIGQPVLPVAQEREVVVGQPLQQRRPLGDLLVAQRRRGRAQLLDDLTDPVLHPLPVLDRLAHVEQHLLQPLLDRDQLVVLDLAVDLDVHPGLAPHVGTRPLLTDLVALVVDHLGQPAGDVAADEELRVDDEVDVATLLVEGHRHRVDEERHVVGDHLDHGVPTRGPAVLVDGRGEDPHVRGALRTLRREGVLADGGAVQVDVGALDEVLDGHVAVVLLQERLHRLPGRSAGASPRRRHGGGTGDEVGLGFVVAGGPMSGQRCSSGLRRHLVVPSPRP